MYSSNITLRDGLLHPVLVFFYEASITSIFVGFTRPHSLIRLAALPLVIWCPYVIIFSSLQLMRAHWASLLSGTAVGFALQYVHLVLLSQRSFQPDATTKASSRQGSLNRVWKRLRFGFSSTFSFRDINLPTQVKNVPQFSQSSGQIPSRKAFILQQAITTLICGLVLDISANQPPPPDYANIFAWDNVPFLTRICNVTGPKMSLKLVTTLVYWINMYCVMQLVTSVFAIIAVGLNISYVAQWRPLYGSPLEAYTLRRFWSVFWHQTLRQILTSPASFICHRLLHLSNGFLLTRYLKILLTFALSGMLHALAELGAGLELQNSGTMRFFCTQVIGIMIEDGIQAVHPYFFRRSNHVSQALWARLLGYLWVVSFLVWSTPAWFYPNAAEGAKEGFLPFGVVRGMLSV